MLIGGPYRTGSLFFFFEIERGFLETTLFPTTKLGPKRAPSVGGLFTSGPAQLLLLVGPRQVIRCGGPSDVAR